MPKAYTLAADSAPATIDAAIADLRGSLVRGGAALDPLRIERLHELTQLRGGDELFELTGQLLSLLRGGADRGRSRDLTTPLAPESRHCLGTLSGSPFPGVLPQAWPLLAAAFANRQRRDAATMGMNKGNRVAAGDPRLAWIEAAITGLAVGPVSLFVGGTDQGGVLAADLPEPSLLLGKGILAGDPASRFRVGRALECLRWRCSSLEVADLPEWERLFAAAVYLTTESAAPTFDAGTLKAEARGLAKFFSRRDRKTLEALVPLFREEPSLRVAEWRATLLRGADRAGLLVAGNVAAALRVITGHSNPAGELLNSPRIRELVAFALSERHANLRRALGVGEAPL